MKMKKMILGLFSILVLSGCGVTGYSEGERSGELVKFAKKGLLVKSWEGELKIQEGGSSQYDNGRWNFSVIDENEAQEIKKMISKNIYTLISQGFCCNKLKK